MQVHNSFDARPIGKINSYEDFYLTQRKESWVPDRFIDKKIFEFDSIGQLTSVKAINCSNNETTSEVIYEYLNGEILREIDKSKWGKSITTNFYNDTNQLIRSEIKNSSGDNYSHNYEYDSSGRLEKSTTEFKNRIDTYEYLFSDENSKTIKTTKINNEVNSIEYLNNGLLEKLINSDNETIEFTYDKSQRLLVEKRVDITREFIYNERGLPIEYHGYVKDNDFNNEYYEFMFDNVGNWIEIKCYEETESFPKHLKTIRKRVINYT